MLQSGGSPAVPGGLEKVYNCTKLMRTSHNLCVPIRYQARHSIPSPKIIKATPTMRRSQNRCTGLILALICRASKALSASVNTIMAMTPAKNCKEASGVSSRFTTTPAMMLVQKKTVKGLIVLIRKPFSHNALKGLLRCSIN